MHLQKIGLLFFPLFAASVWAPVPLNFPALLATSQVLAQTPNDQKLDQNSAVSGSFVDYLAEEVQFKGHEGSVNSASFSPDGKYIVTASKDNTARVWDRQGKQLALLSGNQEGANSFPNPEGVINATFSPNGKYIVTVSPGDAIRVWDTSGKLLTELNVSRESPPSA